MVVNPVSFPLFPPLSPVARPLQLSPTMNTTLTAAQIAEMNDPARFAREEAVREATRRADKEAIRRRRVRALHPYRTEIWASAEYASLTR